MVFHTIWPRRGQANLPGTARQNDGGQALTILPKSVEQKWMKGDEMQKEFASVKRIYGFVSSFSCFRGKISILTNPSFKPAFKRETAPV
jgi:hypothetical protein